MFNNNQEDLRRVGGAENTHPTAHLMRRAAGVKRLGVPIVRVRAAVLAGKKKPRYSRGEEVPGSISPGLGLPGLEISRSGRRSGWALVKTHQLRPDLLPKVPPLTSDVHLRLLRSIAGSTVCPAVNFPTYRRFSVPRPSYRRCRYRPPAEPTVSRPPPCTHGRPRRPCPVRVPAPRIPVRHAPA